MTDDKFDFDNVEEPDPGLIAFLDQEQAAFDELKDEFLTTFGFYHKCRCAEDYGAKRMVEVTECFAEMVGEALSTCQKLNHENEILKGMLESTLQMIADSGIAQEINDAINESAPESDSGQENN